MKNLIEELHKLDETEYKVSADFSKRVMKKIKKNKNINKINYVISLASAGAVACLAVVAFNNSNIKSNIFNFIGDSKEITQENAVNDSVISYYDINNTLEQDIESQQVDVLDTLQKNNITFDEIIADDASITSYNNQIVREENKDKDENELSAAPKTEKMTDYSEQDYQVIINILKNAKIDYTIIEDGLKANASKERIEGLLKNKNIIIEEKEGYVIIKLK